MSRSPSRLRSDDELTQRVETRFDEEDTSVGPSPLLDGADGYEPLREPDALQSTALMDMSATAAAIDMDWDEEDEPQTNMRDELLSDPPPRVTGADFDPVVHVPAAAPPAYSSARPVPSRTSLLPPRSPSVPPLPQRVSGAPSPFARPYAPTHAPTIEVASDDPEGSWDDDDARTRVLAAPGYAEPAFAPPARPTVPPPAYAPAPMPPQLSMGPAIGPAPWDRPAEALRDDENPFRSRATVGWPWIGLAAVLAVGLALTARSMMAPPALATVTLSTVPVDAQVSVDGRPLIGQTSPFTIQGLSPEAEHTLLVSSEGRGEHRSSFRVSPGETKALPSVELAPKQVETGFVLASSPPGARVLLDGQPLDVTTPARLTDIAPGPHTLRLEHGDGYQPWETQIELAAGQLLELPAAQLTAVASANKGSDRSGVKSRGADRRAERRARRAERRAEQRAARAASASRSVASRAPAPVAAAAPPPPVASGSGGTLRVNTRPWSQVFVDGKLVGNTPQLGIPLRAGSHKVKLVNPDLGLSKQITIKMKAGQTVTKVLNLVE